MTESTPQFAMLPWYPRDFASATTLWPLIAKGAFRELLDLQWNLSSVTSAGVLPEQPELLRAAIRASAAEWKIAWPLIEPKFPKLSDGGRQNARLELHRQEAVRKYLARQKGANATNSKRWGSAP
jgi:hypothetical protein